MNREDLKKYKYSQKWIERQLEYIQEQKARAEGIKTTVFDDMPKARNKPNYAIEDLIDNLNKIIIIINREQDKQSQILNQIVKVQEPFRTILTEHYVRGNDLYTIAGNMHYSYERIRKLNARALILFEEVKEV